MVEEAEVVREKLAALVKRLKLRDWVDNLDSGWFHHARDRPSLDRQHKPPHGPAKKYHLKTEMHQNRKRTPPCRLLQTLFEALACVFLAERMASGARALMVIEACQFFGPARSLPMLLRTVPSLQLQPLVVFLLTVSPLLKHHGRSDFPKEPEFSMRPEKQEAEAGPQTVLQRA